MNMQNAHEHLDHHIKLQSMVLKQNFESCKERQNIEIIPDNVITI